MAGLAFLSDKSSENGLKERMVVEFYWVK